MGDLSPHFSRSEFDCHGRGVRGHPAHPTIVRPELLELLEAIRGRTGGHPLHIVSGHRCSWWNERVGGAERSQHLFGAAADLRRGVLSRRDAVALGVGGIGTRGDWAVHVDVRQTPATWRY